MSKFFYSEYSNYAPEQIADEFFKKTARELLEKAPNDEVKEKLSKILYDGGFDEFTVNSNLMNLNGTGYEAQRRKCFASLLLHDPETFNLLVDNNILLFHGTNSNALPNILKNGMYSELEMHQRGEKTITGESSLANPRDFISFTDHMDLALNYATLPPTSQAKEKKSFGILIGLSVDDISDSNEIRRTRVSSDTPELGILRHLPNEYIKLIAVPQIHIQEVLNMINEYGLKQINVVPVEGILEAVIEANKYNPNAYKLTPDCLESIRRNDNIKQFGKGNLKAVADGRRISKIRQIFNSLKEKIRNKQMKTRGEEDGHSRD